MEWDRYGRRVEVAVDEYGRLHKSRKAQVGADLGGTKNSDN